MAQRIVSFFSLDTTGACRSPHLQGGSSEPTDVQFRQLVPCSSVCAGKRFGISHGVVRQALTSRPVLQSGCPAGSIQQQKNSMQLAGPCGPVLLVKFRVCGCSACSRSPMYFIFSVLLVLPVWRSSLLGVLQCQAGKPLSPTRLAVP